MGSAADVTAQITSIEWRPCFRIISSRFPPVSLFDKVANPDDLDAVFEIEAMTNDRLRDEVGHITMVAPEDRVSGPGTTPIMAAFTHLNPAGSRFSNGSYGVFYAALAIDTAIAETKHHRMKFMAATKEPAQEVDMRVYAVDLNAELHDARPLLATQPAIYDGESYAASQAFATTLREAGSHGIAYHSVRHEGGECAAVFKPRLLNNCRQERHLCYVWDGTHIAEVYEKRPFQS